MDNRLGSIEINGTTYPLNYSMRIAQQYNDITEEDIKGDFAYMERNLKLLALLMEDGAAYQKAFGGEPVTPMSLESLRMCLSPVDSKKVSDAIVDTMYRAGVRRVEAKPGKNGKATPGASESQTQKKE